MTETELKSQFQVIEDHLNEAYEWNDTEKISNLLSDDWIILESLTGLSGKEQFLKAIKVRNLIHSKMKKKIVQVRLYDNVAIVVTRGKNEDTF